ncbi:MAG: heme exporter protein CcmB, partial [Pseudomonadota bacterium]
TVGIRRGGLVLSILVLPLYIPTLIFGARAVENALLGLSAQAPLVLTGAISLFAIALAPFAAAAALRVNLR